MFVELEKRKKINFSFARVLGDSPKVKLWEFLIIGRNFEYNISDIAKGSDISRPTCHSELKDLLAKGIVIRGKKYKGKQLYKLNLDSAIAKSMIKAFKTMIYKIN